MADPADDSVAQGKEDSNTNNFRGFSLYTYNARRPNSAEVDKNNFDHELDGGVQSTVAAAANEGTVSDFLRREATSDYDFSLSLLTTNLSGEQETELRTFIAKRLSRGTVYSGSGNISTLETFFPDDSALCYYCLLRGGKDDGEEFSGEEEIKFLDFGDYLSKDFVVCLMSGSQSGLELFQKELDDYSKNLLPCIKNLTKSDDVKEDLRFLEAWYDENVRFVCRCTLMFKEDIAVLIQLGLSGAKLELQVQDERTRKDIMMFVEACSTVNMLGSDGEIPKETEIPACRCTSAIPTELVVKLDGSDYSTSSQVTTRFCRDWAKTMLSGEVDNPVFIRQVIENYKLRVNQDMNTLKRLLRQAETDHYAVYRSYAFLVKCGNGPILLRNTALEARALSSEDTLNVIEVLEEYIEENGIFGVEALSHNKGLYTLNAPPTTNDLLRRLKKMVSGLV